MTATMTSQCPFCFFTAPIDDPFVKCPNCKKDTTDVMRDIRSGNMRRRYLQTKRKAGK
jgi:predicted Zn-ribbon and HTH transcriptional regulator